METVIATVVQVGSEATLAETFPFILLNVGQLQGEFHRVR